MLRALSLLLLNANTVNHTVQVLSWLKLKA